MDQDHWIPVGMAMEDTEAVFNKIKAAVENTTLPASAPGAANQK